MNTFTRLSAVAVSLMLCTNLLAQEQRRDTTKTAGEGSNRNLLMNAASASQPRQISLAMPISMRTVCLYLTTTTRSIPIRVGTAA